MQSRDRRTFLIHAQEPEGDHDIVGKVNVTDVVRGRFESAAIGYDAFDPYAGRGLFAEGLRLVLNLLFAPESAGGMGLHRVAAAVQPGNLPSAGLLRSLGFQREGFSPQMLWLPGADGSHVWRDHLIFAVRREDWPTESYAAATGPRVVVLVNGGPGSGATTLARQLAAELRVPLFTSSAIKGTAANGSSPDRDASAGNLGAGSQEGASNVLWALLQDSPCGAVVESWFRPQDVRFVVDGLRRCGLDPARVLEVWCDASVGVAWPRSAGPLGLGPTVVVDTRQEVGRADVVRIALQVCGGGT